MYQRSTNALPTPCQRPTNACPHTPPYPLGVLAHTRQLEGGCMPPTGRNKGKQPMTPTTHTRPTTPAEEQATAKAEKHCPLCATVFETANPGGFALSVGNAAMGGLTRGGGWVSSLCQKPKFGLRFISMDFPTHFR
jgi:hypothetical protein